MRIDSLFEAKNLLLDVNLSGLSQSSEDSERIASLRRKSDIKVQLKYMISSKQKTKKQFCKTSCPTNKILAQNNLLATMKGKLVNLIQIFPC